MSNNEDYTIVPEERANAFREQWNILQNIEKIKDNFAVHIYEQLVLQNESIKDHYGGVNGAVYGRSKARNIILDNTIYCGDLFYSFFVLCNPKDGQPSFVAETSEFSSSYSYSNQERVLIEYIADHKEDDLFLTTGMVKKGVKAGVKTGARRGAEEGTRYMSHRGASLQSMAQHYSSGHAATMRVNRSIRGKIAQKKAFAELFKKSEAYAKYASRYKMGGKTLGLMAEKMKKTRFKPVTLIDVFTPQKLADGTWTNAEKSRMEPIIKKELEIYCRNNNNYQLIMNQQYFEQGY